MYTKSIIQQKIELFEAKSNFKCSIENLMEKYNIEDSVFVYTKNSTIQEVVEGYFVIEAEYTDLMEAISACNINNMGIRVMENKSFQIGTIHNIISECDNTKKVFDLKRLKDVR
jgi:hypothetical protein